MAKIMTGDRLINSVRRRTMSPDDVSTYTDSDILDVIEEEMTVQVLDKLIKLHGENLTVSVDVARNSSGIYTIPYRAIGNKLRDVSLISGSHVYELSQISVGEIPDYSYGRNYPTNLDLFYVQNNKIHLLDEDRGYDSIRIRYYLRPNYLTKTNEAGVIGSITTDVDANTVTLAMSSMGRNFVASSTFDLIQTKTPNKILSFDLTPTAFVNNGTTGTITFAYTDISDIINDLAVGDYVSLAGETPIPNLPAEMHPLIAQAAAVQIVDSFNDSEALASAEKRLGKISESVQFLIDDRVELAPKKIKPRYSTLRGPKGIY